MEYDTQYTASLLRRAADQITPDNWIQQQYIDQYGDDIETAEAIKNLTKNGCRACAVGRMAVIAIFEDDFEGIEGDIEGRSIFGSIERLIAEAIQETDIARPGDVCIANINDSSLSTDHISRQLRDLADKLDPQPVAA